MRGTVTKLTKYSATHEVAAIAWEGGDFSPECNGAATANLCKVAQIAADAAL